MSAQIAYASIPVSVLFDESLSREARLLYAAVWWWDFSKQHPTQEQMAQDIGCSVVNVWRGIRDLEAKGLVKQTRGGYGKPNRVTPLAGPVPQKPGAQSLPKEGPEPSHRRDRPFPKKGRVVTTQEGENNPARALRRTDGEDAETVRAVESADGREGKDARRQKLLGRLHRGPINEHRMSGELTGPEQRELYAMHEEGLVTTRGECLKREFILTQEG